MSESKFKYDKNIPAEILPSIQKNLESLEDLIPPWCFEVLVVYSINPRADDLPVTTPASCEITYHYRHAEVVIYPNYFNEDETARMDGCIHEMVHVVTLILYNYAEEQIKRLLPESIDKKYLETLLSELEERNEAMVCDLTHILQKRLGVGKE